MKTIFKPPLHMGNAVKQLLKQKGIKHGAVSDRMKYDKSSFSQLLGKADWSIGQIKAVGDAIDVNLFTQLPQGELQIVNEDAPKYGNGALKDCQETNALLKENNSYLKKHIAELETQLKKRK